MFIASPEKVVFESRNDIIDYVSKGFPPKKNDMDRLMYRIHEPMSDDEVVESSPNDVVISRRIFDDIDSEQFAEIVQRIYENNVRNRNLGIAGFLSGLSLGILVTAKICGAGKSSDDEE